MTRGKHSPAAKKLDLKINLTIPVLVALSLISLSMIICSSVWIRGRILAMRELDSADPGQNTAYALSNEHILPSLGDDDAYELTQKIKDLKDFANINDDASDENDEALVASPSDSVLYVSASASDFG